jgi:hypothetical protein
MRAGMITARKRNNPYYRGICRCTVAAKCPLRREGRKASRKSIDWRLIFSAL